MTRGERDAANNAKLLSELDGVPAEDRGARFVCVLVVATPDGRVLHVCRGTFEGRIGVPPAVPAGENGFGYDPLFLVGPDHTTASAELLPDEKSGGQPPRPGAGRAPPGAGVQLALPAPVPAAGSQFLDQPKQKNATADFWSTAAWRRESENTVKTLSP